MYGVRREARNLRHKSFVEREAITAMIFEKLNVGHMGVNCYIVGDCDEVFVIDPGGHPERICNHIKQNNYCVKYIILTHCHFDHILAAEKVKIATGAKLIVGQNEAENLADNTVNMTARFVKTPFALTPDLYVTEGDILYSGKYAFTVIETPGHTSGSICLYCPKENILFSGDTLFRSSVGRSDFPTGNQKDLINSIQEKLFTLPEDTIVYPGHDSETSIEFEKNHNPYIR